MSTVIANYGNLAGPYEVSGGDAGWFKAWVQAEYTSTRAVNGVAQFYIRYKTSLYCGVPLEGTTVDIQGTGRSSTSGVVYGEGWYMDSGWINHGWVSEGGSISVWCKCYYTGGSGRTYTSEVTGSWTAPKRSAHGKPGFSASKNKVSKGESVTLTLTPSPTQGNAQFYYYEISDGMGNNFFTSNISASNPVTVTTTDTPSEVLDKYGADAYLSGATGAQETFVMRKNCVYYAAREIHEWYGIYPASDWVWIEVEVKTLTVTVYDASGNARKGAITIYDSQGNAQKGTVTIYDANGAARN